MTETNHTLWTDAHRILRHSICQVTASFRPLVRIAIRFIPLLVVCGAFVLIAGLGSGSMTLAMIAFFFLFAILAAMAIAFHRYILTGETAFRLRWRAVARYVGMLFVIQLAAGLAIAPLTLSASLMVARNPGAASLVFLLALVSFYWVSLRLSPALVAIALEEPPAVLKAWQVTAPLRGALVVISLALIVFQFGGMLLLDRLTVALDRAGFGVLGVAAAVCGLIFYLFAAALHLSLMTTLFGHCVQRRDLI